MTLPHVQENIIIHQARVFIRPPSQEPALCKLVFSSGLTSQMPTLSLYHKAHGDTCHFHTILTRTPGSRGESAAAQCSGEA